MAGEPTQPISGGQKFNWFLAAHWRGLVFIVTPFLFAIIFLFADTPIPKYYICGYTLLVMAVLWVTEAIPVGCTSSLPIFIFPTFGILSTTETCFAYMTDTVIMVIVSLLLAFCFEASGLHQRMALGIVQIVGYTHARLLFGISMMTMFISMWVVNMAATTMMLPIITAVLQVLERQGQGAMYFVEDGESLPTSTSKCYFLISAFSSSVGGIGTLVGTGTNLAFKGLFEANYPEAPELLGFTLFSAFTIPLMLTMNLACYFYMGFYYMGFFRPNSTRGKEVRISPEGQAATKAKVLEQWRSLGSITYHEIIVIDYIVCMLYNHRDIIKNINVYEEKDTHLSAFKKTLRGLLQAAGSLFMLAILLFITRSPSVFHGWADALSEAMVPETNPDRQRFIRDSSPGMFIIYVMFLVPSTLMIFDYFKNKARKDLPGSTLPTLLDWSSCEKKLPWEFLLLLGGGFALSTGSRASGLLDKIGNFLTIMKPLPQPLILLLVCLFTCVFTNLCANVAVANILCPIAMELAKSVNMHPLMLCLATGLGASFCYCLPIGTPCNAIAQAKANIRTGDMLKCGGGFTIISAVLEFIFIATYARVIWNLEGIPEWANF